MKKAVMILGLADTFDVTQGDYIGVDRGSLMIIQNELPLTLAVGDFDSVSQAEKELIQKTAQEIIELPAHKDETDTQAALKEVLSRGYDEIEMFGALGGRIDHTYANLTLLKSCLVPLTMSGKNNRMTLLKPGVHEIDKRSYKYCSFFALKPSVITLEGFAYPLDKYSLMPEEVLAISNEILGEQAIVRLEAGQILAMQCSD